MEACKGTSLVAADSTAIGPSSGPNSEIATPELQAEQTEEHGEDRKSSAGSHIKARRPSSAIHSVTVRERDPNFCDNSINPTVQGDRTSSAVSVKVEDLYVVISTLVAVQELYQRSRNNESPHGSIYWSTVYKMVCCFAFGFTCSISHRAYYLSLNGKPVGPPNHQQWALRYAVAPFQLLEQDV
jgi:hypothetical protein